MGRLITAGGSSFQAHESRVEGLCICIYVCMYLYVFVGIAVSCTGAWDYEMLQ